MGIYLYDASVFQEIRRLKPSGRGELEISDAHVSCRSTVSLVPMSFLMAQCTEGNQILGSVIAQSASRTNVMDLKILDAPAQLAAPAISLQDFPAELAISFCIKPQAWPPGTDPKSNGHLHIFKELLPRIMRP